MQAEKPDDMAMHADERRTVGVIALVAMIRMFGLFALLPVLSLYAWSLEDATPLLVGLAVGGYGLTQAGLQIPLGALSDRVGRMPVILGGLAVFAAGSILAATSDSIYGVVAGRLLQGAGAISATLTALVTDATRASVRTRSMAVVGIGIGSSFMVAMVVGPLLAAQFGVPALFWIAVGLTVVAALLLQLLPDIPRPKVQTSWNLVPAFRADLLRVDFYMFLLHAIMTATFVALPFLFVERLELPVTEHWKMYVGALLVSLVGTVPLIMADDRQGKRWTVQLALLCQLAGCLLLGFAGFAIVPVILAMALFFVGQLFHQPADTFADPGRQITIEVARGLFEAGRSLQDLLERLAVAQPLASADMSLAMRTHRLCSWRVSAVR